QRLTVDVLLEQIVVEHQSELPSCTAPRLIGTLVNDVLEVRDPARVRWTAIRCPLAPRLAAVPTLRCESENFRLHAASHEHPGYNLRARGGHADRCASHG